MGIQEYLRCRVSEGELMVRTVAAGLLGGQ
jgi:hypothetical protein